MQRAPATATPSSIAFPYHFVQALGNITRQHFRQLRSVSGDLSCIYPALHWPARSVDWFLRLILADFVEFTPKYLWIMSGLVSKLGKYTVSCILCPEFVSYFKLIQDQKYFTVLFVDFTQILLVRSTEKNIIVSTMTREFVCEFVSENIIVSTMTAIAH